MIHLWLNQLQLQLKMIFQIQTPLKIWVAMVAQTQIKHMFRQFKTKLLAINQQMILHHETEVFQMVDLRQTYRKTQQVNNIKTNSINQIFQHQTLVVVRIIKTFKSQALQFQQKSKSQLRLLTLE